MAWVQFTQTYSRPTKFSTSETRAIEYHIRKFEFVMFFGTKFSMSRFESCPKPPTSARWSDTKI